MADKLPQFPKYDVNGKVAVVTGGSRGLGKWIALGLAQAGADVLVTYKQNRIEAEDTCHRIGQMGRKAVPWPIDVADVQAVDAMVAVAVNELGGMDILINNAGVGVKKKALDVTPEDFNRVVGVNLRGVYFCSQAAARVMMPKKKGKIINIASAAAFLVRPGVPSSVYAMTKAGIVMLTKSFAEEWSAFNINVNAVAPGYFPTPLTAPRLEDPEMYEKIMSTTPLKRLGQPPDIMAAVTFLASDASGFITGQTLCVDGGRTIL
jgi:NAD(P)-dependent dehydrogenase (short-subunit alcohol dehydrogenase family)